jgi:hypothetical protein
VVVLASVLKRRECWKRDREEEVVLAAVQEEVLSESKEKSRSAQRSETLSPTTRLSLLTSETRGYQKLLFITAGPSRKLRGRRKRIVEDMCYWK